jgi:hypothetical protein
MKKFLISFVLVAVLSLFAVGDTFTPLARWSGAIASAGTGLELFLSGPLSWAGPAFLTRGPGGQLIRPPEDDYIVLRLE